MRVADASGVRSDDEEQARWTACERVGCAGGRAECGKRDDQAVAEGASYKRDRASQYSVGQGGGGRRRTRRTQSVS